MVPVDGDRETIWNAAFPPPPPPPGSDVYNTQIKRLSVAFGFAQGPGKAGFDTAGSGRVGVQRSRRAEGTSMAHSGFRHTL